MDLKLGLGDFCYWKYCIDEFRSFYWGGLRGIFLFVVVFRYKGFLEMGNVVVGVRFFYYFLRVFEVLGLK